MRHETANRRSSIGKRTMSKCFGLNMRNAYSYWGRRGPEFSWGAARMKKTRQINRGCIREGEWQRVDNLYLIHAGIGSQCEEFWGGVKHGLVYELWAWVLQLSFEPSEVSQGVKVSIRGVTCSTWCNLKRIKADTSVFVAPRERRWWIELMWKFKVG